MCTCRFSAGGVVAGAGDGQLGEVEADAPAATRQSGGRVQQAGWRQVVRRNSALTR